MAGVEQIRVPVEDLESFVVVPLFYRLEQEVIFLADGDVLARRQLASFVLFAHDVYDHIIFALLGYRQRAGGVPVRVDAGHVIGSCLHQYAHRLDLLMHHRVVDSSMFVVLGHVDVDQVGLDVEDLADRRNVTVGRRLTKISYVVGWVC